VAHRHRRDLGLIDGVHHDEAVGVHGARTCAVADAERIERGECVGAELDARADLADVRGLLEDLDRKPLPGERERGGKTADTSARD
jgi:hypothetical protein